MAEYVHHLSHHNSTSPTLNISQFFRLVGSLVAVIRTADSSLDDSSLDDGVTKSITGY